MRRGLSVVVEVGPGQPLVCNNGRLPSFEGMSLRGLTPVAFQLISARPKSDTVDEGLSLGTR